MGSKEAKYLRLQSQINNLLTNTDDLIAGMATVNAVLYHKMQQFFWVGFYLLKKNRLIVGPYQGPVACQELELNMGVCWASLNTGRAVIVPDVNKFPGHIACDYRSKSEIALPVTDGTGNKIGVFDVDSSGLNTFDNIDAIFLERIIRHLMDAVSRS